MKQLLTSAAMVCALSGGAFASTIDFGETAIDRLDLNGPLSQDGFIGTATGDGWETQTSFAVAGAALVSFFNGQNADVGDMFSWVRDDGGLFDFGGLSWRTILGSNSDQALVEGLIDGAVSGSFAIDSSSTDFQTIGQNAGFGAIDTLRITITTDGNNALIFDDIVLNVAEVPLPASLPLLAGALGLIGFNRRRKAQS